MNWVRVTPGMQASPCTPCVESWALCPAEPLSAPCLLTRLVSGRVCERTGCNLHVWHSISFNPNKRLLLSGLYLLEGEALTIPRAGIEFGFIPNYNIKLNRTMFTHIVQLSKRYQQDGEVHIAKSASALNLMSFPTKNSRLRQLELAPQCAIICAKGLSMWWGSARPPCYTCTEFHFILY